MAQWNAYDIDEQTIYRLEKAEFFIEFCAFHAQQLAELHGAGVLFDREKLRYAFIRATFGLAYLAREIRRQGPIAPEPDDFKRCGYICFWLRRAKPFVRAVPMRKFPDPSRQRDAQGLFCRHPNELFAFDLMFRVCAAYEGAVHGDARIATAGLNLFYLNDVCVSLTNNSVSPQSMYLIYRSLFETVGR